MNAQEIDWQQLSKMPDTPESVERVRALVVRYLVDSGESLEPEILDRYANDSSD